MELPVATRAFFLGIRRVSRRYRAPRKVWVRPVLVGVAGVCQQPGPADAPDSPAVLAPSLRRPVPRAQTRNITSGSYSTTECVADVLSGDSQVIRWSPSDETRGLLARRTGAG